MVMPQAFTVASHPGLARPGLGFPPVMKGRMRTANQPQPPGLSWRHLKRRNDTVVRPGEFGGRYVCELLVSLPDSSAL